MFQQFIGGSIWPRLLIVADAPDLCRKQAWTADMVKDRHLIIQWVTNCRLHCEGILVTAALCEVFSCLGSQCCAGLCLIILMYKLADLSWIVQDIPICIIRCCHLGLSCCLAKCRLVHLPGLCIVLQPDPLFFFLKCFLPMFLPYVLCSLRLLLLLLFAASVPCHLCTCIVILWYLVRLRMQPVVVCSMFVCCSPLVLAWVLASLHHWCVCLLHTVA